MNRIEGERIVRNAALLLRGEPPRGELVSPEWIADLLIHHGLGAYGSWQVSRHNAWRRKLDGDALKRLDQTVLHAKIRRNMVTVALADALEILRDFHPVLFKGLALAQLYPQPYLRDPGDLDILLGEDAFDEAVALLQKHGWRLQPSVHRDHPPEIGRKFGFAQVFRHPVRPVILDLHRDPMDKTEPFWVSREALTDQTIRLSLSEGISVSTLTPTHHLALTALHSIRHGTFRLAWTLDVHFGCLAWKDEIDREEFVAFCRRWNILRAVHVGLEVARQLHATPWTPLDHLPADRTVSRAAARRSPWVVAKGHLTKRGSWRRIGAILDLVEGSGAKAAYLKKTLFPSRELLQFGQAKPPGMFAYLGGRLKAMFQLFRGFRMVESEEKKD